MSSSDGALQSFQWDKFHGYFVWSVIYSSLHNYMYNYCTESFSNVCLCGKKVIQRRSFSYFNFSNINKFKTHCVRNTMQTAKWRVQLSGPIYMSLMDYRQPTNNLWTDGLTLYVDLSEHSISKQTTRKCMDHLFCEKRCLFTTLVYSKSNHALKKGGLLSSVATLSVCIK